MRFADEVHGARGRELESLAHDFFAVDRRRRWSWSPRWLPVWPFWESDRALRARVERLRTRRARQGTEQGMCEEVAEAMGCDPREVQIEITGPGEFAVAVPRRLGFDERMDVERAVAVTRPACTRCVAIREG